MSTNLTQAAARMRERADAATPGIWTDEVGGSEGYYIFGPRGLEPNRPFRRERVAAVTWGSFDDDKANAAHIASWHPQVAPLVADLLEAVDRAAQLSGVAADHPPAHSIRAAAQALADSYLGEA